MLVYLFKRCLQSFVVLFIISFLVYGMIGLMPGDPIDLMISSDPNISSNEAEHLKKIHGLEEPLLSRYENWILGALRGDLGYSRLYSKPVLSILKPAFQNTLILMGISIFLAFIISLPLAILASMRPHSKLDNLINILSFVGISVPPFWLAILLIIVFSVLLGIFPASGQGSLSDGSEGWGHLSYLVLPVLSLTLASIGNYIRYIRASLIETLRLDFVKTARAKGLSEIGTLFHHALRVSMIPFVTIISLDFGFLFSGALVTETVFSFPGMGKLIFDSIMGNDFNLALAGLLFATFFTLVGSLLADIAYVLIDPRISYRV